MHTFLNLALAIHMFSHFFACTIRSPLYMYGWGIHVKSWKMVFFSCILKEDYWSSFWYGVHSSARRAHRLFKRSFLKEPFRKEREKKNCRFIVNHASKWRHHGSFQIFFTPPFPLDTWVMMLFYAGVCSPAEFQVKTLLTSSLRQSRAWWLMLFLCFLTPFWSIYNW